MLATDLEFVHEPEFLPYQAVFAAREEDQDDSTWEVLEEVYRSPAVTEAYEKENRGLGVISQASHDDLLDYQQRTEEVLQTR
ncbi:MetQ/NlpA family ABC transporter substrate-binding protein [Glutamicibacter sp. MNS18]|uniref:MetQ/NlpA family ABC transporter substrate-binding protein n=1 Tax=Glutamicibacter sp. MNS18 TaxID=2989817 RepID=UPI00223647CB|nr:MetQ/NlpA family ABC transporter substrate-binding protein [Glutamicibacter sp. MNS18]MCW4466355.1 MetQ/NlpA family ABC transporter substrate-binding protein [Glutamicibacter sp. MNS18]